MNGLEFNNISDWIILFLFLACLVQMVFYIFTLFWKSDAESEQILKFGRERKEKK